jgi:hypothetical protein
MIVCKFGNGKSLKRRTKEHTDTYSKIKGCTLNLKYFSYIDPQFIFKAETYISHTTKTLNQFLDYKEQKELVVIKPKSLNNHVKTQYEAMAKLYGGCMTELTLQHKTEMQQKDAEIKEKENIIKIRDVEMKAMIAENNLKIERKDNELLQKDNELLQKDNENNMTKKDLEIAELKLQMYSMNFGSKKKNKKIPK